MPNKNKIGYRPTWAQVSLKNLEHNFKTIKSRLLSKTKIMVTVKADAYGHGLIPVARRLVANGVNFFGVASIDEGIRLRNAGIKTPVLILGVILKKDILPLFTYNLTPTVCDFEFASALNHKAAKLNTPKSLHIKVDTGMGRIGVLYDEACSLVEKIHDLKFIKIDGIFTHFPLADTNRKFTLWQIKLFQRLVTDLNKRGIDIPLIHAANSMGLIDYRDSYFTMVRPGLAVYGLYPKLGLKINLRPVLSLKTRVIFIKQVPVGYGVSYGHTYKTKRCTRIATLPIGYGDGYPRNLSNLAWVLIANKKWRISGRICMDQIMVDVGSQKLKVGDEVVLIGKQGTQEITAEELADLSKTIPYEIVCGLGSRIPRIYIS